MDLRDQFAGMVLQGLLSNPQNWMVEKENLVASAYSHADAMIAERGKFHGLVTLPKSTFDALIQENSELKLEIEALKGGVQ